MTLSSFTKGFRVSEPPKAIPQIASLTAGLQVALTQLKNLFGDMQTTKLQHEKMETTVISLARRLSVASTIDQNNIAGHVQDFIAQIRANHHVLIPHMVAEFSSRRGTVEDFLNTIHVLNNAVAAPPAAAPGPAVTTVLPATHPSHAALQPNALAAPLDGNQATVSHVINGLQASLSTAVAAIAAAPATTQENILIPVRQKASGCGRGICACGIWRRKIAQVPGGATPGDLMSVDLENQIGVHWTKDNAVLYLKSVDAELADNIDYYDSITTTGQAVLTFVIAAIQAVKLGLKNTDTTAATVLDAVSAFIAAVSILMGAITKSQRDKAVALRNNLADSEKMLRPS